nr:MAG TPA: Hepatocyte nuclear factor 4-alpha, Nuclear Factor, Transcription-DNA complex [Bacteriophage sp.]
MQIIYTNSGTCIYSITRSCHSCSSFFRPIIRI